MYGILSRLTASKRLNCPHVKLPSLVVTPPPSACSLGRWSFVARSSALARCSLAKTSSVRLHERLQVGLPFGNRNSDAPEYRALNRLEDSGPVAWKPGRLA